MTKPTTTGAVRPAAVLARQKQTLEAFYRGQVHEDLEEAQQAAQDAGLSSWNTGSPRAPGYRTNGPFVAPLVGLIDHEQQHLVRYAFPALARLPYIPRQVVRRACVEQRPYAQIAEQMGYSVRWVRRHKEEGLTEIAKMLFDDHGHATPLPEEADHA
jgi:DNA-directed RNA polymerase specialized sigma24 family protein